jgi:hypothetical protein
MVDNRYSLNQKGQTVVEYILLLTVVFALIFTFINSPFYKTMFGENGKLAQGLKSQTEFGYRHAYLLGRPTGVMPANYGAINSHPSYSAGGSSRFFGPQSPYR